MIKVLLIVAAIDWVWSSFYAIARLHAVPRGWARTLATCVSLMYGGLAAWCLYTLGTLP